MMKYNYSEFCELVLINHEIEFLYRDIEYFKTAFSSKQVREIIKCNDSNNIFLSEGDFFSMIQDNNVCFYTLCDNAEKPTFQFFTSNEDFLNLARIDGYTLKEAYPEITIKGIY